MSEHDPFDIRGQEREAEDDELSTRIAQGLEDSDTKWLMSSAKGRRIAWRLLDRAGVFRLSFNTNAMQMAFSEGNRNEGLKLLGQIHSLCPELYPTMLKEAKDHGRNSSKSDRGSTSRNQSR